MNSTFRALNSFNYRLWACGAVVSNIGTWMQRTAQDWLVLTYLTHNNATSVGIVMALQFGPQIFLLPLTGFVADHFDRRKLLIATQSCMGLLALGLGVLTVMDIVQLWHVYVFAFLLGCVAAFDAPVRQTFVSDLVVESDLSNAVALNSTSFNAARMVGPAIAGFLIAEIGTGWVFIINAISFAAVIASLSVLRLHELHIKPRLQHQGTSGFVDGFRYVAKRPDLQVILGMLFLIGTFGLNFPIYLSSMAVNAFHVGARHYGFMTSMMAIGSVIGALWSAKRERPNMLILLFATTLFGLGFAVAASMPNYWLFTPVLIIIGVAAQTFTTTANGLVQLSTEPQMRGRVMAIFLALALGGAPIGAPLVGWVADSFGPRWAMCIGIASGVSAAAVGIYYLYKYRNLRVYFEANGRIRFSYTV